MGIKQTLPDGSTAGALTPASSVVAEASFGQSSAVGVSTNYARQDHTHGSPAAPTSVSGNAGTATALQTARTIDGQSFDGTTNVTVIAPGTHAATSKATPVDADELPLVDSAASNVLKKLTWANLKATLKTYFDTLYQAAFGTQSANQVYAGPTSGASAAPAFRALVAADLPAASGSAQGAMSAADFTKLAGVAAGATASIDNAGATTVLASAFTLNTTTGTFQDTGLSITLPSAGTYKIDIGVRCSLTVTTGTYGYIVAKLYNSTDAAYVANSEMLVFFTEQTGKMFQLTGHRSIYVTVAASKVIKLYAARNFDGTLAASAIESDGNGRTALTYTKISN